MRTRGVAARSLVVLAAVLFVISALDVYSSRVLLDADRFADRATTTLRDPSVRTLIAESVTDGLVLERKPDLLAARPLIVSTVSGVVGGDAFASLFRRAAADLHRAVFSGDEDTATLTLVDVGIVAAAALEQLRPELAAELDADARAVVGDHSIDSAAVDVARFAHDVRWLHWALVLLTLAVVAGAVAVAPDRRRTVWQLGASLVVAGALIAFVSTLARSLVLGGVGGADEWTAASAVWDAYLGDLGRLALLLCGAGAVIAAAAASVIRPVAIEHWLRAAWQMLSSEPQGRWWRVAYAVVLIGLGTLVIADPAGALELVALLVGVLLVYRGLTVFLRMIYRPEEQVQRRRGPVVALVLSLVALTLVAGGSAAYVAAGGLDEPVVKVATCNGHAELCERRFDEVVLPATHNAMSVPEPGWFAALQERPIAGQLQDGIRGLLIDTHYADRLANGNVRTVFDSSEDIAAAVQQDGVSQQTADAALRLRGRLGFRGEGERGIYLCHTFCELGATPLADVLADIRAFLVTNPGEILAIVHQDTIAPADFVAAIEEAGLSRYALTPPAEGRPWPMLRKMIDDGRRLLVMAENEAGAAPWNQLAYERLLQETPFQFRTPAALIAPENVDAGCAPNRGPASAPLFLLNHWVNTDPAPRPSHAEEVNAYEPLLRRARACERIRGKLPNLVAVDFYRRGDVFRVVDTLNGI